MLPTVHGATAFTKQLITRYTSFLLFCFLLTATHLASAVEKSILPPSQDVVPAIAVADSGMKPSGTGKNWSEWYRLRLGRAPEGYTLWKVEFWLTGDRSFGNKSECREIVKSDKQVLWEFRLQGEDKEATQKPLYSEGHIRVTYRPVSVGR